VGTIARHSGREDLARDGAAEVAADRLALIDGEVHGLPGEEVVERRNARVHEDAVDLRHRERMNLTGVARLELDPPRGGRAAYHARLALLARRQLVVEGCCQLGG